MSSSISAISFLSNPAPSLPIKKATWPPRFACVSKVPLCDEVAQSLTPRVRNVSMRFSDSALTTCNRKTDPAGPYHFAVVDAYRAFT